MVVERGTCAETCHARPAKKAQERLVHEWKEREGKIVTFRKARGQQHIIQGVTDVRTGVPNFYKLSPCVLIQPHDRTFHF